MTICSGWGKLDLALSTLEPLSSDGHLSQGIGLFFLPTIVNRSDYFRPRMDAKSMFYLVPFLSWKPAALDAGFRLLQRKSKRWAPASYAAGALVEDGFLQL